MNSESWLDLFTLSAGCTGITTAWGESLAQAAGVCLEAQGHVSPRPFSVDGSVTHLHLVTWPVIDDQTRRCWNDLDEAAEHGAYGITALLVAEHTPFEVVERSRKGTGFDYWLGPKGDSGFLFQRAARLEVSGIGRGDNSTINSRVKQKIKQTEPTDGMLPAYVVVVEYGAPLARIADK